MSSLVATVHNVYAYTLPASKDTGKSTSQEVVGGIERDGLFFNRHDYQRLWIDKYTRRNKKRAQSRRPFYILHKTGSLHDLMGLN